MHGCMPVSMEKATTFVSYYTIWILYIDGSVSFMNVEFHNSFLLTRKHDINSKEAGIFRTKGLQDFPLISNNYL